MAIDKKLVVQFVGDAAQLQQTFKAVIKDSQNFGKEVEKNGFSLQSLGKVSMAVGGTVVGALTGIVLATSKSAGEIEHLSRVSGVTAEQFQRLAYAAKQDDVDASTLSASLARLSKIMNDAANGSGTAAKAFSSIGVNVQTADGHLRNTSDVLLDVAAKFEGMTNPAEKSALAIELFGKSGAGLVPFLEQGKDGIQAFGDEAQKLGLVISNDAVANFDEFGDTLDAVKSSIGGIGSQAASDLIPVFSGIAQGLKSVLEWLHSIPGPVRQVITVSTALAAAVALVGGAIITIGPAIASAMASIAPFVAAAAGIGTVAVLVYNNWNQVASLLAATWDRIVGAGQVAFSSLKLYILTEIDLILKGLSALTGWIPGWGDKLKSAIAGVEKQMHTEVTNISKNAQKVTQNTYDEHLKAMQAKHKASADDHIKTTQEQAQKELQIQDEKAKEEKKRAEERLRLQKEWDDKLYNETHNALERLNLEEKRALERENLTGKAKADIRAYYAKKREDLAKEESQKSQQIQADLDKRLYDQTHTELERRLNDLKIAEDKELAQEGLTEAQKTQIQQIYTNQRNQILQEEINKKQEGYNQLANQIVNYMDQMAAGQLTIKDLLKNQIIQWLSGQETRLIADAAAGVAEAWAQSPITFGASLAQIPGILAQSAAGVAALEAAKAAIRGLAEGGIVTGPQLAMVGEGRDKEAVLPLNAQTFAQIAQPLASSLYAQIANAPRVSQINNSQAKTEVHLHVGTLVADKQGLKQLERQLSAIRVEENKRKGINQ